MTQAEADLACGILRLAPIELHAMGPQGLLALRMAAGLEEPVGGTSYLALARGLDLPMITADRRLVGKVAGAGDSGLPEIVLLG